jgi:hypothetical protein
MLWYFFRFTAVDRVRPRFNRQLFSYLTHSAEMTNLSGIFTDTKKISDQVTILPVHSLLSDSYNSA